MYLTDEPRPLCRTCKTKQATDTEVRCKGCHKRFLLWLDGGYTPQWNGVESAPPDADEPRSTLDRALAKKHADE
jgi:hypothetical protein